MDYVSQDWILHHAGYAPHRIAMIDLNSKRSFTYEQMQERVQRAALYLRNILRVGQGDRIAVLCKNDSDVFEIQFACRRIGAIFVPLNWRLAGPELEYICNDAAPAALLYGTEFGQEAKELAVKCRISERASLNNGGDSDYEAGVASVEGTLEYLELHFSDVSTILYTSGTSGRPKGALISYGMQHFNGVDCTMTGNLTASTRNLVMLPTFHTGGLNVWANPVFMIGGCNVILRDFEAANLLRVLSDKQLGVTHTLGVPTNFLMLAETSGFENADLSHVECLCVGGASAPKAMIRDYDAKGIQLIAMYGMTEIGPLGLALSPDKRLEKLGSAGRPTLHSQMKVCDQDLQLVADDAVGELFIKGPTVTRGYWNKPEETKAAFTSDGWFRTGDAARRDAEGYYYIVDRWKDMFISGGENVYPVEIENALYLLNGTLETAVVGMKDAKWGEVGLAYIVLKDGMRLTEEDVLGHCRKNLAGYKVPRKIRFVDELPHNATGKILKHLLKADD
ncbi:MAG: long-chain fatty acid--CoA ligase [Haliea sp.]